MVNHKTTCEECGKEIKRKSAIGLMVGGKVLPFFCCTYECLGLYVDKLDDCEDDEVVDSVFPEQSKVKSELSEDKPC